MRSDRMGAISTAANLRTLLEGSELMDSMPEKLQDAYSLRCTPQVLGACRDAIRYAAEQVSIELNAAPIIRSSSWTRTGTTRPSAQACSTGTSVGIPLDVLKIAVAEIANLSERRLYRLTTGSLSQWLPSALASKDRPVLDDGAADHCRGSGQREQGAGLAGLHGLDSDL